jgi:hypothetical protein
MNGNINDRPIFVPQAAPRGDESGVVPQYTDVYGAPELAKFDQRALEGLLEKLSWFPSTVQRFFDAASFGAGNPWSVPLNLSGRKIRFCFCSNRSGSPIFVWVGSVAQGKLLDVVDNLAYRIITVGDDISGVTFSGFGNGYGQSYVALAVTDNPNWTPDVGQSLNASTGSATQATQPTANAQVAPNASNVTVKASGGRLFAVTVTVTGTNPLQITDGVGGPVIFALPASPPLGLISIPFGALFSTSLVVVGSATNPNVTLQYA